MTIEYEDEAIRALCETGASTDKRYRKLKSNAAFKKDLFRVLEILRSVPKAQELAFYGTLHYEGLKYSLRGVSSVRIGFTAKYRLLFRELNDGIQITIIEVNEHYGDK